ncbi:MAG: cyclase family protein [Bacteroidetes bacterium]|nr:cyclase family protein [Bacteroidota bacterium]
MTPRAFITLLIIFTAPTIKPQFDDIKIVDLTYTFDESTIYWPTAEGFKLEVVYKGLTDKGYYYSANSFCTAEHGGTHLDAPIHFYENRNSADEIPLKNLIGSAVVIDISEKCLNDRDYLISVNDFLDWENENGKIPERTIVLLKTGFGKYWPNRTKYMGTDEKGEEAVAKLHFPGLHPEAAGWLVTERQINAVGIESPSIDYGQSQHFKTHVILAENNIPIFENVANLEMLPAKNFTVIALPMKIKGGSGGPLRIIALLQE